MRNLILILLSVFALNANGQDDEAYLKANAVLIDNPYKLNDRIYTLLDPFQIIMFGEMHGTNESAPFVNGLAALMTSKGDSIQVGLEITPALMNKFLLLHTDSSIYQSEFFANPPYLDGRESFAWANLISLLNKNPKVNIFFFDTGRDKNEEKFRDSLMSENIKKQLLRYPTRRIITLSGNYHNKISNHVSMTSFLIRDKSLNLASKICSLNMEYKEGTCMANFQNGFGKKMLGSYPSIYNTTEGYDNYLLLLSPKSNYEYNGFYYIKNITAATMISSR